VNADRTTTVDGNLRVGAVSTTVEVTGTPLMNQWTHQRYVVDQLTIQETPLENRELHLQLGAPSRPRARRQLGGQAATRGWATRRFSPWESRHQQQLLDERRRYQRICSTGTRPARWREPLRTEHRRELRRGRRDSDQHIRLGAIGQGLPTPRRKRSREISVNARHV